jgi:hypothetical protein
MALHDLALVGSITVDDSTTVELDSFEPRISDAIAGADAIELEASYSVELSDVLELDADTLEAIASQIPDEDHRELADAIAVGDVLEALLTDGNIHTVSSVTPQRGRAGETVTIVGTGFAASNNNVRLDGTACSIVSQSTTQIVITQPTTFNVTDGFAILQVNNFDNNRVTEVAYWIKDAIADLEAASLSDQEPGPEEFAGSISAGALGGAPVTGAVVSDPTRAEARMWERMATAVDFLLRDLTPNNGDILTRDAVGLVGLDGKTATEEKGQRLIADSAAAEGIRWGYEADIDFPFGHQIPSGTTTARLMGAMAQNTSTVTGQADEWVAPQAGTIDAVYVGVETQQLGTDRLDRVRILVNGSSVHDSGTGVNRGDRSRYFAGNLSLVVAAGDRIQVEITKTGTQAALNATAGVRMQTT